MYGGRTLMRLRSWMTSISPPNRRMEYTGTMDDSRTNTWQDINTHALLRAAQQRPVLP